MKKLFLLTLLYLSMSSPSHAYLDPGTGSVILQAVIAFLAAVTTMTTTFCKKIKELYSKIFSNKKKIGNK